MNLRALIAPVLPNFPEVTSDTEIEVLHEIPVETLYLALKNADAEVILWFFEHAAPAQVQGLIDIDCWTGDHFLPERFETFFKAISLLSPPKLYDYMKNLDAEVLTRGLMEYCDVVDYDPQDPPEVDNVILTPDSKYALILKTERPDIQEMLYLFFNKFSAVNIDLMRRQLEACKWEQPSDLEEFGYSMKKGRLEEMGFVDRGEAMALYSRGTSQALKKQLIENPLPLSAKESPINGKEVSISEEFLPEIISGPLFDEGFLFDAFKAIKDAGRREIILMELLRVMNAALAADDVLHAGLDRIQNATVRSRRYLDLGLSFLSDGVASKAGDFLQSTPLTEVYRLGWLVIQDLCKAAAEIGQLFEPQIFSSLDTELLQKLHGRHPELSPEVLEDLGTPAKTLIHFDAAFKTGIRLAQIGVLGKYFSIDLAKTLKPKECPFRKEDSVYSRLLNGALRQSAGLEFDTRPLNPSEWPELAKKFSKPAFEKAMNLLKEKCPPAAAELFARRLDEYVRQLLAHIGSPNVPDPRFFKALSWVSAVPEKK